jgi:hypothetical protein
MILVVGAPGFPLQTFTVAVPQESAVLELVVRGGSLNLRMPAEAHPVRIFHNDAFLPLGDVLDWSRVHGAARSGDALHVPNVAAGRYQLCSSQRCVEGTLAAGGALELSLGGS